ncbi:helix-turn-helix domain-containing protein [Marinoscillum sp.]|uniref:helix-turn-helix domain-containing protein n=1 Tax=Marinoscillum sp. TaxID=2024838 RepID=UPI003BAD9383
MLLCVSLWGHTQIDSTNQTTIVVDQLPNNTPHDASLYLATDLDGWIPDLESRKFERTPTGKYKLVVNHNQDTFSFKITRGNWDAVEARENGRARPNRQVIISSPTEQVLVAVEAWEDISIGTYRIHMFFLLIMSIQGFLLVIAINTIRNQNKRANSILSILLTLITISLLGRASTFDPDVFTWQPKLIFVPELILFTYGPIFYLYIQKLLGMDRKEPIWFQFAPATVQMALYIPFLMMEEQTLIYRIIDKDLFPYFATTGLLALLFNCFYWLKCRGLIKSYSSQDHLSDKQKKYVRFLDGVLNIKAVYLSLWATAVVIYLVGEFTELHLLYLSEYLIDLLWLLFSLIIFALAYYAVKHPEVLRERRKYQDSRLNEDEVTIVKAKLMRMLMEERIYLKPDLTLEYVAHKIPTATHTLSRVVNEQFDQNFTELINTYRINAFVQRVEKSPQDSYLEAALSVGFNSKPTFNRVFKKIKGCTPRQYFNQA